MLEVEHSSKPLAAFYSATSIDATMRPACSELSFSRPHAADTTPGSMIARDGGRERLYFGQLSKLA